ncbi:Protein SOSEKI 1, partial [Oleoguttula sp. CCFEE 5521]
GIMTKSRKRLRKVFEVVRDILKTLVPDADQPKIEERLDVGHLFQEIDNGVCDLVDLANWLATVIKKHCAPMRDNSVDEMQKAITEGALKDDQTLLVGGLRQLLLLLENMKLDVANHQIRAMRPLLIADTISFQQRYNAHRISIGKLDKEESRSWLEREHRKYEREEYGATHLDALTHALMRDLVFADSTTTLKPTFYLDIDRLRTLRLELHSSICLRIVLDLFHELCDRVKPTQEADTTLTTRVDDIVGAQGQWLDSYQNIAVELVRIIQQVEVEFPSDVPEHERIETAERRLLEDLPTSSDSFNQLGHETIEQLLPRAIASIDEHYSLSAADLQEALVPPLPLPTPPTTGLGYGAIMTPALPLPTPVDADTDLIRRFTHIVVLHWQVWSDLVYLAPQGEDLQDDKDHERRHRRGTTASSGSEGNRRGRSPSPAGFVEWPNHLIPSSATAARDTEFGLDSEALEDMLSLDGDIERPKSPEARKDASGR